VQHEVKVVVVAVNFWAQGWFGKFIKNKFVKIEFFAQGVKIRLHGILKVVPDKRFGFESLHDFISYELRITNDIIIRHMAGRMKYLTYCIGFGILLLVRNATIFLEEGGWVKRIGKFGKN
jgi:hypothetical protein